jgi:hypothetical protein
MLRANDAQTDEHRRTVKVLGDKHGVMYTAGGVEIPGIARLAQWGLP